MIETFKLTTNNEGLNPDIFFEKKVERGDPELHRGNVIYKKRNKGKAVRMNFFSQRVVNPWNKLTRGEVQANKISGFKNKFDHSEKGRRSARENRPDLGRLYRRLYSDKKWQ